MPGRVRAHELRTKSKAELLKQLEDLRNELAQLRVAKVTGGAPSKLAKIRTVRKSIARVLTVISQTQRAALRKHYAKSRHQPLDLRPKFTRAALRKHYAKSRHQPLDLRPKFTRAALRKHYAKSRHQPLDLRPKFTRAALRKHYAKSRHQPLDLRPKFTRALRRQMTPYEQSRKTARERKAASAFPQRVFAVKA
eukprot:CAMPEP_0168577256 /NCGR_PEP_ID=MMETSP0413-20121227/20692_1 /TAXON_ID=136452 /ORGANISM="Filamoeba nolandi, Strain NC-AS-23-1" /LENGTH=193 /DNA_ID=CAMNT_0008611003 /DNA_START=58 /DNA_END=639 /DNA_ORIENTATION=+